MVIYLYSGFPGSGKSYMGTKLGLQIADSPLGKRQVIANFPIKPKKTMFSRFRKKKENTPKWTFKKNDELTVDYLIKTSVENNWIDKEGQAMIIFDEAGIPFNSRTWNSPDRLEWIEFMQQHRKFGYDYILITQDGSAIDKQVRKLCEFEVQHKKMNNMFPFQFLSIFRITLFAAVTFWNGSKYGKGTLKLAFYRKKISQRYDTMNLFGYGDAVKPK